MHFLYHHAQRGRPNYQRPNLDMGTQELQEKRQQLIKKEGGRDMILAESLLGILYARRIVSKPLYDAGCFFRKLRWDYQVCLGYVFRPCASALFSKLGNKTGEKDSPLTEEEEIIRTKAWREALDVLRKSGHLPYHAVLKIVFYDQDLYREIPLEFLDKDLRALRRGLQRLHLYFVGELKDSADRPLSRPSLFYKLAKVPLIPK